MQRENYYILLDLSIDPPEKDLEVIQKAIQAKKVEWSRLRNHPTKGLQIQKFINMIPDIEKVMSDETLRQEEAQAAAEFIETGKESKISEIDGHIDILMGKGYIAKEDIIRLAEIHGLSQNEINDRINTKKNAKYTRIDQQISLRMGKGYITEEELIKVSKKNGMEVDEIRKRIRCPIIKDEKEAENLSIRPLDKSIERSINENLNVIGKKSLYDFLGLIENAELKRLQETAGKKKKDLASGKKDAVTTAGVTLAGQCLTIFKSNETRIAYDVSLAKAKLSSLDSDINIAAINNKIRHEYFDALVNKAMEFGMDQEEAASYIQSFCQKKKYRIEKPPEKKRRLFITIAVSALTVIIIIAGFFIFSKIHHKNVLKSEYQELINKTDAQTTDPDRKVQLLKGYADSHGKNEYTDDVKNRIRQIESQINLKKYNQILKQADQLLEEQKFDDAIVLFNHHLAQGLNQENKKTAEQKIKEILTLIEKRDFEELSNVALKGEADQKINIFHNYLETHPKGKNRDQVQALIDEMSGEYFIYAKKKLASYEKHEQWEECLQICQKYVDIYDNSNSDLLKQLMPKYQENIRNKMIYESLIEKAEKQGTNYDAAAQIFRDYLEAYPESSITEKIKQEINRLDGLNSTQIMNQATNAMRLKFAATKGRFIEKHPGVITDTTTGLMWCMIDSDNAMPDTCLTYEQGKEYIKTLTTGGFTDWRLPSPEELAVIFKTPPTFPVNGKKSYWTSESYSGYSDGWQIQVATFSSENSILWDIVRKNALDCGSVRAVRKP